MRFCFQWLIRYLDASVGVAVKSITGARRRATSLKVAGYGLGVFNMANIEVQYANGEITGWQRGVEQASNLFSTFGGLNGAAGSWSHPT
jgi:hypothetical protein